MSADHGDKRLGTIDAHAWWSALKRSAFEAVDDQVTHWAGALTYYAVLSLFPALLVLVSVLGLLGASAVQPLLDNLTEMAPGPAREIVIGALESVRDENSASGLAFAFGLAVAIFSTSRYINGFMDACNIVYEVEEGRPWQHKWPLRLGITVLMLVLVAISALAVVVTGPVAEQVGQLVGLGDTALTVWGVVKWPVLVLLITFLLAVLYWVAPNVEQPSWRWITPGSVLAVVLWVIVSLAFAAYVASFGSYNETYGTFAGVAIFLVWLWLTNIAFLLGAEFNAELERCRAIARGHPREEEPFLPLRREPD